MDFKSPSVRLGLPFLVLIIVGLVIGKNYGVTMVVVGMLFGSLILVFRQPIHWYWYSKKPPLIPIEMRTILEKKLPYYNRLSAENKRLFLHRMSLFIMAKETESLNEEQETLPADMRGLIAATAVQLSFGLEEYLFPDFKKIIVHPSLFLSASLNHQFHASETYLDPNHKRDSCLIFAADRMMHSFKDAKSGYNIVLHESDKELGESIAKITKQKIFYVPFNPTAENLGLYLINEVCPKIFAGQSAKCVKIHMQETPEYSATVTL